MSEYKELTQEEIEQEDMEMGDIDDWEDYEKERKELMTKMKPDALIAVHINEEGKIESTRMITCFLIGDAKYGLEEEFDPYMLKYHGFLGNDIKPNTLYHVYVHIESYRCSYEYDEWDTEHYYLQVIPVVENYSKFLADEEEYQEQKRLEKDNRELPGILSSKEFRGRGEDDEEDEECYGWSSSVSTHLTYNDLKRMVHKLAEVDIYLAHRIYSGWSATQILGKYFSKRIADVEEKRRSFRSYLTSNYNRDKEQKVKLTEDGYKLPKTYRYEEFTITHEEIDNLPDEWLMDMRHEDILKQMFEAKKVAQKLIEAKGNNKKYINVVNG